MTRRRKLTLLLATLFGSILAITPKRQLPETRFVVAYQPHPLLYEARAD